jgi:drug/metabolite transporter (DMT)-like permease
VNAANIAKLLILGALWGGSFLFMRAAAPEFGPVALIAVRMTLAAAILLAVLHVRGGVRPVFTHARPLIVVGVLNSALPFCLLAYATLYVTAGFAAVLNGTTPFFAAIVARMWLKAPLTRARVAGLVIGFGGVLVLVWGKVSFKPGGSGLAIVAGLFASLCYGIAASYTRRRLPDVPALAIAAGSMAWGAVCLLPLAAFLLPHAPPSPRAWGMLGGLSLFSTAVAYVLYFHLLARLGPTGAVAVTFLIPAFAMAWGWMFLGEAVTGSMALGTAIVLAGTGLTSGVARRRRTAAFEQSAGSVKMPDPESVPGAPHSPARV